MNTAPELIPASLDKAARLNARFIVPQHYDVLDGILHRVRFDRMLVRLKRRRAEWARAAL